MDQEEVNKDLTEKDHSDFQQKVVEFVRERMKWSTDSLKDYHPQWEEADKIYRGYRLLDKKDEEAANKKEPTKVIIPVSYAMTQTALSFLMSTLFVDDRFFRLKGRNAEDQRIKEAYETDLNYQMDKIKSYYVMYNWLQDAFKYGIGVVSSRWKITKQNFKTYEEQTVQPNSILSAFGRALGQKPEESKVIRTETVKGVTTFEGTDVQNISPYCFYPDPNVPAADFEKGAFVAHEDETSKANLSMEEGITFFGVHRIPNQMPMNVYNERHHRVGKYTIFSQVQTGGQVRSPYQELELGGSVIKVDFEFTTTGRELKDKFDYDLGPEFSKDEPIKMLAVVANDQKVIKFEPLGYLHGKYSYDVIEYSPDHNAFVNPGLTETIYNLQEIMTWFLNSHVQNVRKSIKNRLIGDPNQIYTSDLTSGREFIRTKDLRGKDIRNAIFSLEVNDITRGHVADMQVLQSFMQLTTGINDNALGQYSGGRRSATQSRNVGTSAMSRLKMHGKLAWSMGIEPLGQKMITNTNQLRSKEYYNFIMGEEANRLPYEDTIITDPAKLVGGFDFIPYEGTLPDEKQQRASTLTELAKQMFGNPQQIAAMTGYNLGSLIDHILRLQGIKNIDDFKENPEQLKQKLEVSVLPDAEIEQLKQQGKVEETETPSDILASLQQ